MATDEQIINFLALGDSGAAVEAWTRPGQPVFNAVQALGETWDNVHRVLRQNREEIDSRFRARNAGGAADYVVPFAAQAGDQVDNVYVFGTDIFAIESAEIVWDSNFTVAPGEDAFIAILSGVDNGNMTTYSLVPGDYVGGQAYAFPTPNPALSPVGAFVDYYTEGAGISLPAGHINVTKKTSGIYLLGLPAGHQVGGGPLSAGTAPATGIIKAAVWVPLADYPRDNLWTFLELDDDPDFNTLADIDLSAVGVGAGTDPAGVGRGMSTHGNVIPVTLGQQLWYQFGGTGGTAIPVGVVHILVV